MNTDYEEKKVDTAWTPASFVGVLICATVAGCASMSVSRNEAVVAGRLNCAPVWPVQITQIEPDAAAPWKRQVTVEHEPAHVHRRGGTVRWQLTGQAAQGYEFTPEGITFKDWPPVGTVSEPGKLQYDWCFPTPSTPYNSSWSYAINFSEKPSNVNGTPVKKWKCDPTVVSSDLYSEAEPSKTFTCDSLP